MGDAQFNAMRNGANQTAGTNQMPDMKLENMSIAEAVFVSLGAASACWDNLMGAGVFESDRCREIGEQLMQRINLCLTEGK